MRVHEKRRPGEGGKNQGEGREIFHKSARLEKHQSKQEGNQKACCGSQIHFAACQPQSQGSASKSDQSWQGILQQLKGFIWIPFVANTY